MSTSQVIAEPFQGRAKLVWDYLCKSRAGKALDLQWAEESLLGRGEGVHQLLTKRPCPKGDLRTTSSAPKLALD